MGAVVITVYRADFIAEATGREEGNALEQGVKNEKARVCGLFQREK